MWLCLITILYEFGLSMISLSRRCQRKNKSGKATIKKQWYFYWMNEIHEYLFFVVFEIGVTKYQNIYKES